jgi:hypothetical protein
VALERPGRLAPGPGYPAAYLIQADPRRLPVGNGCAGSVLDVRGGPLLRPTASGRVLGRPGRWGLV